MSHLTSSKKITTQCCGEKVSLLIVIAIGISELSSFVIATAFAIWGPLSILIFIASYSYCSGNIGTIIDSKSYRYDMMTVMIICNAIVKLSTSDVNAGNHVSMCTGHADLIMGHRVEYGFV
jgi:hypothetical protein